MARIDMERSNVFTATVRGTEWARIANGQNYAIVTLRNPLGQVESIWPLDVAIDSPLGRTPPPGLNQPLRLQSETKTIKGFRASPGKATLWSLVAGASVYAMIKSPSEVWGDDYDCDANTGQCIATVAGLVMSLTSLIVLATAGGWEKEVPDQEAIDLNNELRRAANEAKRVWGEMQQKTRITVKAGPRIPPPSSPTINPGENK